MISYFNIIYTRKFTIYSRYLFYNPLYIPTKISVSVFFLSGLKIYSKTYRMMYWCDTKYKKKMPSLIPKWFGSFKIYKKWVFSIFFNTVFYIKNWAIGLKDYFHRLVKIIKIFFNFISFLCTFFSIIVFFKGFINRWIL